MKKIICMMILGGVLLSTACEAEREQPTLTQSSSESESTYIQVDVDTTLAQKTEEELFREASLIVYGTVTAKSDGVRAENGTGGKGIFTDCTFVTAEENEPITVRVHGGVFEGISEVHSNGARLEIGESYLLFLYQPEYDMGEHYYVLGMEQGVFIRQEDGNYLSQYGLELSAESLAAHAPYGNN